MRKHQSLLFFLFCVMFLLLTGCSGSMTSGSFNIPIPVIDSKLDTNLVQEPVRQEKSTDISFHKVWVKSGFDAREFDTLFIAPVNTQFVMDMEWLESKSSADWYGGVKKDIEELGVYFHAQVVKEFKNDPNHSFQVIDTPGKGGVRTLRLELALTEIDPSKPVLNAAGWLISGGAVAKGVVYQRKTGYEGRLRDLQTGEVVATFADRDLQNVGSIDLSSVTWYGPAETIMDQWARQLVQIGNCKPAEIVTDQMVFSMKPF